MVPHSLEFRKAQRQFDAVCDLVRQAEKEGRRVDQVERDVFGELLRLGLALVEAYVAAQGDGDAGETLEHGERTLRRLPQPHVRRYLSIFGELLIRRYVYGTREGQQIEQVPLDAHLGLPEGEFSYVLEDWLQRLCVKESFGEASAGL